MGVDEPRWHLEPVDEERDLPPEGHHQPDEDPPDLPPLEDDQ